MPTFAQETPVKWSEEDLRLKQTVSVANQNISIAELLETFSKQTGVELNCNRDQIETGISFYVSLNHVPLCDAIEAISSLLSLKRYQWKWGKAKVNEKANEKSSYRLFPVKVDDLAMALKQEGEEAFFKYMDAMRNYLALSREEQIKQKSVFRKAVHMKDNWLVDSRLKEGISLDLQEVSIKYLDRSRLERLVRSEQVEIPLSEIDAKDIPVIDRFHNSNRLNTTNLPKGVTIPIIPGPLKLIFSRFSGVSSGDYLTPVIMVGMNDTGGSSCFGTELSAGLREEMYKQWILDGDQKFSLIENAIIPEKEVQKDREGSRKSEIDQGFPSLNFAALDAYLQTLHQATDPLKIPVVALLSKADIRSDVQIATHSTLGAFLTKSDGVFTQKMHKWRQGILLINTPFWMNYQKGTLSGRKLMAIKKAISQKNGKGTLEALCNAMLTSSPEQWDSLKQSLPELQKFDLNPPIYSFSGANPGMFQPNGLPLTGDVKAGLAGTFLALDPKVFEQHRKIRWNTSNVGEKEDRHILFTLEMSTPAGAWESVFPEVYSIHFHPINEEFRR